ncbi:MAG: DUF4249 domain-containing protein [Phaeodactylibacter sp.]|uniref:DUF4249 domain-containing protein n=1 Tax=Phaeodactylibacter sp. TaxID=1940289 RepID=UPI0032EF895D
MNRIFLIVLGLSLFALSCEQEFVPASADLPPEIVVEGYIEAGAEPRPPFVILTRSTSFFSEFSAEDFNENFVSGADVRITDGQDTVQLEEVCLDELSPLERQLAAEAFGLAVDSLGFNFCVYIDMSFSMIGEEGKAYTLLVEAEGQQVRAVTRIPEHVPIDSLRFQKPPGEPIDTLAQLLGYLQDPAGVPNFYRYQVGVNGGPVVSPGASVSDDRLFDGEAVEFPLLKPIPRGSVEIDLETFGLYTVGDTITVKWMALDKAHFDFWNTVEFNTANQGPFSSYTLIESNVEGGLGIWGGISASYYTLPVAR